MKAIEFDKLLVKVRKAVEICGRCDDCPYECPYGGKNNECPKKLHEDIELLLAAFSEQLEAAKAEKSEICQKVVVIEDERMYLEKRLKHLLQSETIRQFDAISPRGGDYERDISELDEIMKSTAQKEASEAIFKKIAKNCESDMSADELKKTIEAFDHLRQACKGVLTKAYW